MPLKVSDGIGAWIKDFKKSDAPQFKGKDEKERRDMALAAYLNAKRGDKKENVDFENAKAGKRHSEMMANIARFTTENVDEKTVGYKRDSKLPNLKVPIKRRQGKILNPKTGKFEENQPEEGTPEATKKAKSMTPGYTSESLKIYEAQFISPKMYKVKQLARLGLVNKQDVQKLLNAMDTMGQGKELPKKQRDIIFGAFGDLIDLVTGDKMIFQKAKKAVKEDIQEADDKDPGEYDEEGLMMKDQLDIIMDAADEMYDIVEDNENLPEWVQNKITKAADYIDSSRDYLMAKKKDNSDD
jgi:hypothetical protein